MLEGGCGMLDADADATDNYGGLDATEGAAERAGHGRGRWTLDAYATQMTSQDMGA